MEESVNPVPWNVQAMCFQAFKAGVEASRQDGDEPSEEWLPEFAEWWGRFAHTVAWTQALDEMRERRAA